MQLRPRNGRLTEATLGGAVVGYRGQHFDELTWAQRGYNIPETGTRYYDEPNAHKQDLNVYARANASLTDALNLFADLQTRYVRYELFAPDGRPNGAKSQQTIHFATRFSTPRPGLTFQPCGQAPASSTAASLAVASREPARSDFTDTARRATAPAAERAGRL